MLAVGLWLAPPATATVAFGPKITYPAAGFPSSLVVEDFNGDEDPDLAYTPNSGTSVSVRLGEPGAGFGPATDYSTGRSTGPLAVGDFNADGDPDLAATTWEDVSVLVGGPGGGFGPPVSFPAGPAGVIWPAAGDFNGDGDPDLAVTNQRLTEMDTISVLLGGPGADFGPPTAYPAGSLVFTKAIADFNGDEDPDLATADAGSDAVSVLLGAAGGTFGSPSSFAAVSRAFWVATGEFNGDGDPDLAVSGGDSNLASVLRGRAGGTFGAPTTYPVGQSPQGIAVSDLNRDGDPDLAIAGYYSSDVSVLDGGPGASFEPAVAFPTAQYSWAIGADDFNADGNPDLVVANQDANRLSVLISNGVDLSPGTIAFPAIAAGDGAAAKTVVLRNNRDQGLTVSAVRVGGTDASAFVKGADTCAGATVAPGGTCSVAVSFRPRREGAHSARLSFSHDAPASPQPVALSGTGTPPVAMNPAAVGWNPRPDSTTSSARTVTLTNLANRELRVDRAALAGTDASSFLFAGDSCTGAVLASDQSCEVRVRFRPDGTGPKSAAIEFTDDAPGSPRRVALSGTGTPGPWLTTSPGALKFGYVSLGTTSPAQSVTLTNTGSAPMNVNGFSFEGDNTADFTLTGESCTALASLGPDQSCSGRVAFRPTATGSRVAKLAIMDTAPRSPHRVGLQGRGR